VRVFLNVFMMKISFNVFMIMCKLSVSMHVHLKVDIHVDPCVFI